MITISMRFQILPAALLGILVIPQSQAAELKAALDGKSKPIQTQNAKADFRPHIHLIISPNGSGKVSKWSKKRRIPSPRRNERQRRLSLDSISTHRHASPPTRR
ncbi:hypothetical protein N9260_02055 [bacterium]|nr:hypothetical protein [bacterium]